MWLNLRAKLRPQFGADLKPRLVCRPSRSLSWWPKKWTSFAERALANRKCCARLGANEPKSACTPEACSEISRHPETRRCATCRSFPAFGLWRKRPGVLTGSAVGALGKVRPTHRLPETKASGQAVRLTAAAAPVPVPSSRGQNLPLYLHLRCVAQKAQKSPRDHVNVPPSSRISLGLRQAGTWGRS